MLSDRPRSVKEWKRGTGPDGWNSPDPMPGTHSGDLERKSKRDLEEKMHEVEKAMGLATDRFHDEEGMRSFFRYLGIAILGGMASFSIPAIGKGERTNEGEMIGLAVLGVLALMFLILGCMSQRGTERAIILEARKHDRDRVIRALDRLKN